jgi:hypothetical protein
VLTKEKWETTGRSGESTGRSQNISPIVPLFTFAGIFINIKSPNHAWFNNSHRFHCVPVNDKSCVWWLDHLSGRKCCFYKPHLSIWSCLQLHVYKL